MADDRPMGDETRLFLAEHGDDATVAWLKALARREAGQRAAKIDPSQIALDVLVKAARHRRELRGPETVRAWMRTTLVREVMARLQVAVSRTQALGDEAFQKPSGPASAPSPQEEEAEKREAQAQLYRLLEQMSAEDREVICLHWLEEMPNDKLAELLEIREAALRQRCSRAFRRLRDLAARAADGDQVKGRNPESSP